MAKAKQAKTAKTYDILEEQLKNSRLERLNDALKKTERVALRLTRSDKMKLDFLATRCGLTATDLLTRLIDFAFEKLEGVQHGTRI